MTPKLHHILTEYFVSWWVHLKINPELLVCEIKNGQRREKIIDLYKWTYITSKEKNMQSSHSSCSCNWLQDSSGYSIILFFPTIISVFPSSSARISTNLGYFPDGMSQTLIPKGPMLAIGISFFDAVTFINFFYWVWKYQEALQRVHRITNKTLLGLTVQQQPSFLLVFKISDSNKYRNSSSCLFKWHKEPQMVR